MRFTPGVPPDGGSGGRLVRKATRPAPASSASRSIDTSPALTGDATAACACPRVPSGGRRVNACGSASSTFRKTARPAAASRPARSCEASWASAGLKETARPAANPHVFATFMRMSGPRQSPRATHSWRNVQRPRLLSASHSLVRRNEARKTFGLPLASCRRACPVGHAHSQPVGGGTEPPALMTDTAKAAQAASARSLDELFARQDAQFQRSLASLCAECVGLAGPDISIEVPALPPETQSD